MLILSLTLTLLGSQSPAPKLTPPPGEETVETRALLEEARKTLESGGASISSVLCNARFMPIHDRTPFRELIRDHAHDWRVEMSAKDEPGERLTVLGEVREKDGAPTKNALVYLYHTSAKGWYSDKAAHISGDSGDTKHARLFAYVRTSDEGRFEVRTIRPVGYPDTDLPAHIHLHIRPRVPLDTKLDAARELVSEIQFDDDPRLTSEWRARSKREGAVIVPVERTDTGAQRVHATFTLR